MSQNDKDSLIKLQRLSASDDYYNIVFKKTERIASAVFYILSFIEPKETTRVHYDHLSSQAMNLHLSVSESLTFYVHEASDRLFKLQHALVTLDSALELAAAGRVLTNDLVLSVKEEIELVLRYLRNHYRDQATLPESGSDKVTAPATRLNGTTRRKRTIVPKNDFSSEAILVYSDLNDRTTRIKTVLEAKPDVTIKDLSEIITDVSSKTIQRDLNSLIESGEVIRVGERRWSKYSLVNK